MSDIVTLQSRFAVGGHRVCICCDSHASHKLGLPAIPVVAMQRGCGLQFSPYNSHYFHGSCECVLLLHQCTSWLHYLC